MGLGCPTRTGNPPAKRRRGRQWFTIRVAPLDTAFRGARRFRKCITYEAFKAGDTRASPASARLEAQARSRKESNDEQRNGSNDEAACGLRV